jgi:hypothetical protein
MVRKAKAKTAMVFNPTRRLTVGGGSKTNPARKRRRRPASRRRNPVKAVARRRSNPIARRANPSSVSGLLVAAVMAGVGVSVFDLVASRIAPQNSAIVRAGVKLGGAYAFQNWGGKLPILGKYKNDIALVLAVAGVVDLMKLYVFPLVASTAASVGLGAGGPAIDISGDDTTGNIYGNAYSPSYSAWS